ncbi:MAG: enoyl-CoA hydratase [Kiritimatiellia bacterium]
MQIYTNLLVEPIKDGVQLIVLNRPSVRNALTSALLQELVSVLSLAEVNDDVRAVVITGGDKVFAAGADLKEMAALDMVGVISDKRPGLWRSIYSFPKPIVAAVNGFALGGGCELAMHADIIIAGDNAQFGQPEINLGIIPGAGGTQRLIRTVGKSLAMKLVLSGEFIGAQEARQSGLVAEITVPEKTIERAVSLATTIASKPFLAVKQAKEVLLMAFETDLDAGLKYERKAFTVLSATEDRQEGISAFLEKRKPEYKGR